MQGTKIRLLIGGLLLAAAASHVQAETLQPDPAWQQGKLDNGFTWQLLTTPQRPSDRIELRLLVRTGSLAESAQQSGYTHFLPRLALMHSEGFSTAQLQSLWQQGINPQRPLPPAVSSYDFTLYNLSLPNNRPDLLKDALNWLANTAGKISVTPALVSAARQESQDPVGALPQDTQDAFWRARITGSTLVGHNPDQLPTKPVNIDALIKFYHQWYTPDVMTLFVVGNVDGRTLNEQINRTFSPLKGSRQTPQTLPTLSELTTKSMTLMDDNLTQDRLSLMWDSAWQPIQDSQALAAYWRSDLAREALFWHLHEVLKTTFESKKDATTPAPGLGFDCNVQFQRAQCSIRIEASQAKLPELFKRLSEELLVMRDKGISQAEFDALIAQKNDQLSKLFATYARTDTDVLMSQRLRSQQNGVVDIAPEQYQQLRQQFLSTLTLPVLNQELKQQLSRDPALIVAQPKGEPEVNAGELRAIYDKIMAPAEASPAVEAAPTAAVQ
ncbi:MAG: pitrilysin family protein [Rahnella inusitata]|jgi:zinc protease|uniref:M16 family metallopeptidase n=1 Tax=Rahnella inusitata TaxID=58169 RepID=UPI0017AF98F4|nr:pitrilysin family protein [Rahnella inusitata]NMC25757.1 insulinase family protein [Serratia sp. (in: enterobacteria)]QUT15719.1 insulinase family protein [Rahnella inusitata]